MSVDNTFKKQQSNKIQPIKIFGKEIQDVNRLNKSTYIHLLDKYLTELKYAQRDLDKTIELFTDLRLDTDELFNAKNKLMTRIDGIEFLYESIQNGETEYKITYGVNANSLAIYQRDTTYNDGCRISIPNAIKGDAVRVLVDSHLIWLLMSSNQIYYTFVEEFGINLNATKLLLERVSKAMLKLKD